MKTVASITPQQADEVGRMLLGSARTNRKCKKLLEDVGNALIALGNDTHAIVVNHSPEYMLAIGVDKDGISRKTYVPASLYNKWWAGEICKEADDVCAFFQKMGHLFPSEEDAEAHISMGVSKLVSYEGYLIP